MKCKNRIWYLVGIVLLVLSTPVSCTYDYFLPEYNINVRVAEVVSPHDKVDNVLVVVHNSGTGAYQGSAFLTKTNGSFSAAESESASFTGELVRFKVPQSADNPIEYQVACFVNVDTESVTELTDKERSSYYIRNASSSSGANIYSPNQNLRAAFEYVTPPVSTSEYIYFTFTENANLVTDTFQARVQCWFQDIPNTMVDLLDRIVIRFKTSTHFYLDGYFYQADSLAAYSEMNSWVEYEYTNVGSQISGSAFEPTEPIHLFPSPGASYFDASVTGSGFAISVEYYDTAGNLIGETSSDNNTEIPVYDQENGGTLLGYLGSDFSVASADYLRIIFSDFLDIFGIFNLADWDYEIGNDDVIEM